MIVLGASAFLCSLAFAQHHWRCAHKQNDRHCSPQTMGRHTCIYRSYRYVREHVQRASRHKYELYSTAPLFTRYSCIFFGIWEEIAPPALTILCSYLQYPRLGPNLIGIEAGFCVFAHLWWYFYGNFCFKFLFLILVSTSMWWNMIYCHVRWFWDVHRPRTEGDRIVILSPNTLHSKTSAPLQRLIDNLILCKTCASFFAFEIHPKVHTFTICDHCFFWDFLNPPLPVPVQHYNTTGIFF